MMYLGRGFMHLNDFIWTSFDYFCHFEGTRGISVVYMKPPPLANEVLNQLPSV